MIIENLNKNVLKIHSHKKRKDSLETRAALFIFLLELETSGVAVRGIHQNSEKWWLCEECLIENDFEAVLAIFCCYDHGAYPSETVQKIATDQKIITNALYMLEFAE